MTIELELQIASNAKTLPHPSQFRDWVAAALANRIDPAELTIRIVDEEEMTALNHQYRDKNKPTNVLSFPFEPMDDVELELPILGDIIICADVVSNEALEGDKPLLAHWAHMVIHGCLHLLGYDHIDPEEAEVMESLETDILVHLGYPPPYGEHQDNE